MSNSLALKNKALYQFVVTKGEPRGGVYNLLATAISIGRSRENDIVLSEDQLCSRKHATLTLHQHIVVIRCASQSKLITVNGKEVTEATLRAGDKVQIGGTVFELKSTQAFQSLHSSQAPQNFSKSKKPLNKKALIFLSFGVFFIFLFLPTKKKINPIFSIRTPDALEKLIDLSDQELEKIKKIKKEKNFTTSEYKNAQAIFLSGMREYKNQIYNKAIDYFYACLSLFPEHKLCNRYLSTSHKMLDQKIQNLIRQAKWHKDKQQYRNCSERYGQVLNLVKNKEELIYKESQSNKSFCDYSLKEIY